MPRYGGATSAMKKMKARIARARGVPSRNLTTPSINRIGLRAPLQRKPKPGFEAKIRRPFDFTSSPKKGVKTYPNVDVALKAMKRWNPKLDRVEKSRRK